MDRNSNKYTFIYSVVMVVVVAAVLTVIAVGLGPRQQKNVELEKKINILRTINIESNAENVEQEYDRYITDAFAVNPDGERIEGTNAFNISIREELAKETSQQHWPVYLARTDDGSTKYIFTLDGKGLWGAIWGYVSLNEDLNTVYGVNFNHASETPGLGAQIATPAYQSQFKGKQIFDANDNFVSIQVVKRGAEGNPHAVDAISGGTITSQGAEAMLESSLTSYLGYINNIKNQ